MHFEPEHEKVRFFALPPLNRRTKVAFLPLPFGRGEGRGEGFAPSCQRKTCSRPTGHSLLLHLAPKRKSRTKKSSTIRTHSNPVEPQKLFRDVQNLRSTRSTNGKVLRCSRPRGEADCFQLSAACRRFTYFHFLQALAGFCNISH